eukprot:1625987-Pyramimonas_sp.AAC.1
MADSEQRRIDHEMGAIWSILPGQYEQPTQDVDAYIEQLRIMGRREDTTNTSSIDPVARSSQDLGTPPNHPPPDPLTTPQPTCPKTPTDRTRRP